MSRYDINMCMLYKLIQSSKHMFLYIQNLLWDIPRCNIYATIMSDLLHQIKKGVWKHIIEWFQKLIEHHYPVREANLYLDELDKRISLVPRFMGIKSFPRGIRNIEQITAGEYAHIMKVVIFFLISI